jgi:hypothetical protein
MSVQDSFTASEWRTLEFAPLWAFFGVAGIDRNIDEAETAVLATELNEALLYKDELTRGVLSSVAADLQGPSRPLLRTSGKPSRDSRRRPPSSP